MKENQINVEKYMAENYGANLSIWYATDRLTNVGVFVGDENTYTVLLGVNGLFAVYRQIEAMKINAGEIKSQQESTSDLASAL